MKLAAIMQSHVDRIHKRLDVEEELGLDGFPVGPPDAGAVIVDAVSLGTHRFKKVPVEFKFRVLLAEGGEEALVIVGFQPVKAQQGFSQPMESVIGELIDTVPLDSVFRQPFLKLRDGFEVSPGNLR